MLRAIRKPSRKAAPIASQAVGADGRSPPPSAAKADPDHPREQIDEGRIGERHADADVGGVEEDLRDPEAEQDQQVQVHDPPPAAEVEEAEQEDRRQRQPDVRGVQLVAELARVAARHLPGDLVARPRLAHRSGRVVDDHLHPVRPIRVEVHLPRARLGLSGRAEWAVAPALLGDLGVRTRDADRTGIRQVGGGLARGRGSGRRGGRRPSLRWSRAREGRSLRQRRGGQRESQQRGGDQRGAGQGNSVSWTRLTGPPAPGPRSCARARRRRHRSGRAPEPRRHAAPTARGLPPPPDRGRRGRAGPSESPASSAPWLAPPMCVAPPQSTHS